MLHRGPSTTSMVRVGVIICQKAQAPDPKKNHASRQRHCLSEEHKRQLLHVHAHKHQMFHINTGASTTSALVYQRSTGAKSHLPKTSSILLYQLLVFTSFASLFHVSTTSTISYCIDHPMSLKHSHQLLHILQVLPPHQWFTSM
jgi:hypothetical protein